jgi:hypothetical protein
LEFSTGSRLTWALSLRGAFLCSER